MTVNRFGCGTPIGVPGRRTRCGERGLCTTCWAKKHDQHVPTLQAERDRLLRALEDMMAAASVATGKRTSELIIPAPRLERWWEGQVANMVGQVVTIDSRPATVKWSGPLDGTPEEGASAVVLIVEALEGPGEGTAR